MSRENKIILWCVKMACLMALTLDTFRALAANPPLFSARPSSPDGFTLGAGTNALYCIGPSTNPQPWWQTPTNQDANPQIPVSIFGRQRGAVANSLFPFGAAPTPATELNSSNDPLFGSFRSTELSGSADGWYNPLDRSNAGLNGNAETYSDTFKRAGMIDANASMPEPGVQDTPPLNNGFDVFDNGQRYMIADAFSQPSLHSHSPGISALPGLDGGFTSFDWQRHREDGPILDTIALSATPVPEPPSLALLGLAGILGWFWWQRFARASSEQPDESRHSFLLHGGKSHRL